MREAKIKNNILAIDFGQRRIGLALSQDGFVTPYKVLANDQNFLAVLAEVVAEFEIGKIVIGLPSPKSKMAGQIKKFAQKVKKIFAGEVDFWDETLTSIEAQNILAKENVSPKRGKKFSDALAASLILNSYLADKR